MMDAPFYFHVPAEPESLILADEITDKPAPRLASVFHGIPVVNFRWTHPSPSWLVRSFAAFPVTYHLTGVEGSTGTCFSPSFPILSGGMNAMSAWSSKSAALSVRKPHVHTCGPTWPPAISTWTRP